MPLPGVPAGLGVLAALLILGVAVVAAASSNKNALQPRDCGLCVREHCPKVYSHCQSFSWDACNCCRLCNNIQQLGAAGAQGTTPPAARNKDHPCHRISCRRRQLCMLNIQGLPVCRCPSIFACHKRRGKGAVCARDGHTYPSRCHLRIAECVVGKRIRVTQPGQCPAAAPIPTLAPPPTKLKPDNHPGGGQRGREARRNHRKNHRGGGHRREHRDKTRPKHHRKTRPGGGGGHRRRLNNRRLLPRRSHKNAKDKTA